MPDLFELHHTDKPLRLAIMSTQRAWHGGEAQAELLAAGLRERGHRVSILARRGTPFPERMAAQGYETETFAGRGRTPSALWQIRRQIKRMQPDVLFFNDSHSLSAGTLATFGLSIPVRLAARRVDFAVRSAWPYMRGADRVVCVSNAVANICRARGLPDKLLRIVHDGVDPTRIERGVRSQGRQSLGLSDEDYLLLTVAKLTDHKGHRYLLEALPTVLASKPNVTIAFAGGGELVAELEAAAARLGIAGKVRFLGYRNDVPDLLQAADLVVAPSHLEGLNTSLIDAMLAARPIVTTTAGGIPDLMGATEPATGPNAWVVPPKNPEALTAAILQVIEQPQLAGQFALHARQRALNRFTADRMVRGTLNVIAEVLLQKQRQAAQEWRGEVSDSRGKYAPGLEPARLPLG
jgi:glycosyltransferase involved in cell wall biosynthesis